MILNIIKRMFSIAYSYFIYKNRVKENEKNMYFKYYNILDLKPYKFVCNKDLNISKNVLLSIIKSYIKKYENNKYIISLSGGVDSMVLLSILNYLEYDVIAIHINYNNRIETKIEAEFIIEWCKLNNIKLYYKNITDLTRDSSKRHLYEEKVRKIRFDLYKEVLKEENGKNILLGHHKDDIIENIVSNILRGRNILNLKVMNESSEIDGVIIHRPFINIYKKEIINFAREYNIPYLNDTTPKWSIRGKYRNELLPLLNNIYGECYKENLLDISQQGEDIKFFIDKEINNFLINVNIFPDKIYFEIMDEYKLYPITFWKNLFIKIFMDYNIEFILSKKALNQLYDGIQDGKDKNIALSNKLKCYILNNILYIKFI